MKSITTHPRFRWLKGLRDSVSFRRYRGTDRPRLWTPKGIEAEFDYGDAASVALLYAHVLEGWDLNDSADRALAMEAILDRLRDLGEGAGS